MKTVKIQIKDGKVIVDLDGFVGRTCVSEYEKIVRLLKSLGVEVQPPSEEKKKPEYYAVTYQTRDVVRV